MPKPNILLIVADDLGYGELGCQGNPEIPTPHIDSLAKNGVRFTQGYVTASFCAPSRAALLTGRYQQRFGYESNVIGKENRDPKTGLALTEKTMADHLKAAGYVTGMVGKWHLGGTERFHPQRRGFDEFFGFLHEGHFFAPTGAEGVKSFLRTNGVPAGQTSTTGNVTWSNHTDGNEPPYDADNPLLRGSNVVTETSYLTEAFTREAVGFIERHKGQPWFLYLPYNAVHSPMQATTRDLARFTAITNEHRRMFAAMLASLDDGVGALLAALRAQGIEDNTLIIFLSDNGGPTQELTSSNQPLRGGKGTVFEGGLRIPFLMQWKSKLPQGVVSDLVVSSLDILPTALAAAGERPAANVTLDGVSLLDWFPRTARSVPHETLFWRMPQQAAVRRGDWKILRERNATVWQLFDLRHDPGEKEDLAGRRPEIVADLGAAYEAWAAQVTPPATTAVPSKPTTPAPKTPTPPARTPGPPTKKL
ncbi:MAG TPA: sulfatase-like hydrolase/transferase [Verrucomicrobiae bacterium]